LLSPLNFVLVPARRVTFIAGATRKRKRQTGASTKIINGHCQPGSGAGDGACGAPFSANPAASKSHPRTRSPNCAAIIAALPCHQVSHGLLLLA
jgi:hypothetical protein